MKEEIFYCVIILLIALVVGLNLWGPQKNNHISNLEFRVEVLENHIGAVRQATNDQTEFLSKFRDNVRWNRERIWQLEEAQRDDLTEAMEAGQR